MAHGVESRAPFVNHEPAEWAMQLPDSLKVNYGKSNFFCVKGYDKFLVEKLPIAPSRGSAYQ